MRILIIGGVAAGMSAAAKARRENAAAEIVVYEKGDIVSYGACGLPYYVGAFMQDIAQLVARTKEEFEAGGIQVFTNHEAVGVNTTEKTVVVKNLETGEVFTDRYDKLMIATGAPAVMPPFEGRDKQGIFVLKTLEDGRQLKEAALRPGVENILVIGGGFIGVECVDAFLNLGKSVRLIEAADRLLLAFDPEMSALALQEMEDKQVKVHLNERVKALKGGAQVEAVLTDQGEYPADLVVVAVGVRPATEFLKGSGIELAKNGAVVVDRQMRTSQPDVYAAGDCALCYSKATGKNEYQPLGTTANKCGRVAGSNLAGGAEEFVGALGSTAIKVCGLEMMRTGLGEQQAREAGLNCKSVMVKTVNHPTYYPGASRLVIKLVYEAESRKILGAQICGEQDAVLRGNIFAAAIQAGMTAKELGMTDLAYAPPFSGVWDAVLVACNAAK